VPQESETVRLVIPTDAEYVDVALAAVVALGERAGVDAVDLGRWRGMIRAAVDDKARAGAAAVEFRYDVGDGYLGVTVTGTPSAAEAGLTS
jgi:hypothetical protein